ncbi:MAG: hypothetical protein WBR15_00365 [Gammaproteobacteria bacterium]
MTLILRKWFLLGLVLMLAGCGSGGSSELNNPTITFVTPDATTIAAGATLQLSAIVSGSDNTTVLWYVNNIPGGNSGTVGTISPQGLYTAPSIPPVNGFVVISAAPQVFPIVTTSITIYITFGAGSLNGNYVFTLNGTQSGSPWAVAGSFSANNGTISNGIEDINGPSGISQALPFNGSYFLDADGQGIVTFTSAQGSINMAFTLNTQGQAVVMRTDAGSAATGTFYLQLPTALTLTNLNSPYVFSFTGNDSSGKILNAIGTFVTNGSTTLAAAEEDINYGGAASNQPFTGSYSIGTGGRGTATFTDSTGAHTYTFYIVSPTQLQFIETDTSGNLSGTAFQQQSVTFTTTLAGGYVFYESGETGSAAYGAAGGFSTNTSTTGNINAGTDDINIAGAITINATLTGSFTIEPSGRGTLSLSGASGTNNYVYYLITPSTAFLLSKDSGINASGALYSQSGGYTTAALIGSYTLLQISPTAVTPPSLAVGWIALNGNGALAGYEITNNNGTISSELSVTGAYAVTASATNTATRGAATFTINGGASTVFAFYPISNSSFIMLGESGAPMVATLVSQYQ